MASLARDFLESRGVRWGQWVGESHPPVKWTAKQIEYLRRNWTARSASQIGKRLKRSRDAVISKARRRGYHKVTRPWRPGMRCRTI